MTTTNQTINKRVFTVAGRNGIAIVTDSKIPEGKTSGGLKKFEVANDTQLACLKALNYELDRMPKGVKLDFRVAFLIPKTIGFLGYEDTRKFWLTHKYRKSEYNPITKELICKINQETGEFITPEPIAEELLAEVKKLDELMELQKDNIQVFRQEVLTSPLYNAYKRATWTTLNKYSPTIGEKETVSCNY